MVEIIVLVSFIGIAVGRLPILRMNRASIALVGAILAVLVGGLPIESAFRSLDMGTLSLLFAVMVINVNLAYSGFFRYVGFSITRAARSSTQLLALVVGASGLLSAFFLNDTIVLMLTPLVIEMCASRSLKPLPFLIALALSANIGSMATIIGNPQNILIGSSSGISFARFAGYLSVPALLGLVVAWAIVYLVFRRDLLQTWQDEGSGLRPKVYRPLLVKSCVSGLLMLGGVLAGLPTSVAALGAAAFLLVTRRIKPERVFSDIDWSLLVFFGGLFMLTEAVRLLPDYQSIMASMVARMAGSVPLFTLASVVLSNLISNVPAVMLVRPIIPTLPNANLSWMLLAMATTLAGNLTLLGSVANLIVAEGAKKRGIRLSFGAYLKAGVPVTLITTLIGAVWLALVAKPV
ncbi:MAG TPA: anion transporter [Spirochaetia bacterium]|nr:anion transporter [Spirochaetia bacterium]